MPTSSLDGITLKSHKRSYIPSDPIDTKEAATLLGVGERTIRNYILKGVLRRVEDGTRLLVSLQDVSAMAGVLAHGYDFVQTARTSIRALARVAQVERRVDRMETLMGVEGVYLGTTEEEILAFHRECVDILTDYTVDMPADQIIKWAEKMAGVTEEYLEGLRFFTGEEEPWVPIMEAAQKIHHDAPTESFRYRKDLEVAYGYLAAARMHLRQVSYFYIRANVGAAVANKAFPEVVNGDRDTKLIGLIFSMQRK